MRLILVAGTTRTAEIEGISAAGADADLMVHTPSADAEILEYGAPVRAPVAPVSPTGCPTPALVTRAARDLLGFELTTVDAGLAKPTAAGTVTVGARAGDDIRESDPVPTAPGAFAAAREYGQALPDDAVVIGETIPGGTTTALGVARALGEDLPVSSSLPDNPVDRKREVVGAALDSADAAPGDFAGDPAGAARHAGDPVLAVVAGLTVGALESGTAVTLGGGTQLIAAAAMVRHHGRDEPLTLATTPFLAADVPIREAAAAVDADVTVTDPGFTGDHVATERFLAGEGKEGAGMGGALWLADRAGVPMAELRERLFRRYAELFGDGDGTDDASDPGGAPDAAGGTVPGEGPDGRE